MINYTISIHILLKNIDFKFIFNIKLCFNKK